MAKVAAPTRIKSGNAERWRIRWLDHEGNRRSAVYESHDEAVRALRDRQAEADKVRAGVKAAPPTADKTFAELCDYYERDILPGKRCESDYLSILTTHLRPAFGARRLRELRAEHVDAYKRERAELAPNTVRNHLALLRVLLKLARRLRWVCETPEIELPRGDRARVEHEDRPWLRTPEEIGRFLTAAKTVGAELFPTRPNTLHALYAVALGTGLRAGELAGLRWREVNLTGRTIHVRRSFDGATKTESSRRFVPIVDDLLPILRGWRDECGIKADDDGAGLVFPNRAGNMLDPSARVFHEYLHRVLDAAGFPKPEGKGQGAHYLHFHSLRHTFACQWMLTGGRLDRLQEAMGHTSPAMTRHYANVAGHAHREDFARLGGLLSGAPAPSNVVQINRTAAGA